ncbi:large-conductance mechanosensitive channel protein MscL [soil metagenome]
MGILKEFKEFAIKGNVIDLAVAVVIGAAFSKIVTSLVNDIIMPPIGMAIGGIKFSEIKIPLKDATVDETGKAIDAVTINIGTFTEVAIQFVIVAFAIFMIVKLLTSVKKKEQAKPETPPSPVVSEDVKLLTEIRDLLRK